MEWIQFLQIVCVPAFGWLFFKIGEVRKDLNDFKVEVAKEYATQHNISRLEGKIDNLHQWLYQEFSVNKSFVEKIRK